MCIYKKITGWEFDYMVKKVISSDLYFFNLSTETLFIFFHFVIIGFSAVQPSTAKSTRASWDKHDEV